MSKKKSELAALKMADKDEILRGLLHHRNGDYSTAMEIYGGVLTRHPKHAYALFLMGLLFEAINDQHNALALMDRCLAVRPSMHEAWFNRGVILQWLGRFEDALASYRRALRLAPRFAPGYVNLGNTLFALGQQDEAIRAYERAVELAPGSVEGINNRSFVYLLRGEWDKGWEDYETRWKLPGHANANRMPPGVPWWQGEPLEGKTITLVHEQGIGDTLMMLRYVPGLEFRGAQVILRVPASLAGLCRVSFPNAVVDAHVSVGIAGRGDEEPWLPTDYCLPMMSLPHRFGTMPDTVPLRSTPYLVAPNLGPTLPDKPGFKVGFVWKGSKDHKNDRNRSTSLRQWLPLLAIPGVRWVCLQQETTDAERMVLAKLPQVEHVTGLQNWGETAHVLAQLDVLAAVDTGLTHLSGGMGIPTCVLIGANPDFRHGMSGTDSAWYAETRLIRQPKHGDWETPLRELGARIAAVVNDYEQRRAA